MNMVKKSKLWLLNSQHKAKKSAPLTKRGAFFYRDYNKKKINPLFLSGFIKTTS